MDKGKTLFSLRWSCTKFRRGVFLSGVFGRTENCLVIETITLSTALSIEVLVLFLSKFYISAASIASYATLIRFSLKNAPFPRNELRQLRH